MNRANLGYPCRAGRSRTEFCRNKPGDTKVESVLHVLYEIGEKWTEELAAEWVLESLPTARTSVEIRGLAVGSMTGSSYLSPAMMGGGVLLSLCFAKATRIGIRQSESMRAREGEEGKVSHTHLAYLRTQPICMLPPHLAMLLVGCDMHERNYSPQVERLNSPRAVPRRLSGG
jgi:hypothetical protein